MKRLIGMSIVLFMFSLYGQMHSKQNKALKYLADAHEERITFSARENAYSDKKIVRKGVLIKRPGAKATVLICHGFMCDKFDVSFLHLMFNEYNSMTFDFRGHGEDTEGQYCTLGRDEVYDVLGAAEFIKKHPALKDKPLIVYGFSMGAVASIIAQAQERKLFDAMILDCPFDSTDKLLERGLNQLKLNVFGYEMAFPGSAILKNYAYSPFVQSLLKAILKTFTKMDSTQINTCICPVYPEDAIKYVSVPCFFIGCIKDDKVPEEAVLAVYNGATGFKRLWLTDGRRHYDTIFYRMNEYFYRVKQFIKKCLDGSIAHKKQQKIKKEVIATQPPVTIAEQLQHVSEKVLPTSLPTVQKYYFFKEE
jgi:pimeloyl-ACP methyl ester carboxylesterase